MNQTADLMSRVAAAPISWGVCEAPNWGYQLPADVVLSDMNRLGIAATELGPTGYLGDGPEEVQRNLQTQDLRLVGGFLPVTMHIDPDADLNDARNAIGTLAAAGSDVVVFSADFGSSDYAGRFELTDENWRNLLANLERVRSIATEHGLASTLHPHVNTAIETEQAVTRLLDSSDVPLCLDTGHLLVGGTDPVELARSMPERIGHVHLKDVRYSLVPAVQRGETSFASAVSNGLFVPLGEGAVDIAAIIEVLEGSGYRGWYVLEQDLSLSGPGAAGGATRNVERSLEFVRRLG